mgnify:CR=1 FL=1
MKLIETLRSWLGLGGDADQTETDTAEEGASDAGEEPRLDPAGATETRVETTEGAVDALREARSAADAADAGDASDVGDAGDTPDADDEQESAGTADASDRSSG